MNLGQSLVRCFIACLGISALLLVYRIAQPSLETTTALDLGEVAPLNTRNLTVDVVNNGLLPLTVTKLTASCGCTKVNLKPGTLAFQQHGKLTLNIYAGSFIGPKTVNISIHSNDKAHPVHVISVRMIVNDVLTVIPDHVQLGTLSMQELPLNNEIVVKAGLNTSIPDDLNVAYDRNYLSVNWSKDTTNNCYVIKYAVSRLAPAGLISANIFINSKKLDYSLRVPVDGRISSDFSADPPYIFLAEVGSDAQHPCRVDFNRKMTQPYEISILPEALSHLLTVETQPSYFVLKARGSLVDFKGSGVVAIMDKVHDRPIYEVPLYSGS